MALTSLRSWDHVQVFTLDASQWLVDKRSFKLFYLTQKEKKFQSDSEGEVETLTTTG